MVVNQVKVRSFQSYGFRYVNLHLYNTQLEGDAKLWVKPDPNATGSINLTATAVLGCADPELGNRTVRVRGEVVERLLAPLRRDV